MAYGNYAPFYRGGYFNPMQTPTMPNMAENQNQFAQPYQAPMQTNPAPMQMQTQAQSSNDMIWTQGEAGAKGYLVAPNNTVVLWDTESPTIYIKSADANGIPSMRILDFTERNSVASNSHENAPATHKCTCGDKFATKEQINALEGKIDDLKAKYEELTTIQTEKPKATTKKTKESEE